MLGNGATALHLIADLAAAVDPAEDPDQTAFLPAVMAIVKSGADPLATDGDGLTARQRLRMRAEWWANRSTTLDGFLEACEQSREMASDLPDRTGRREAPRAL